MEIEADASESGLEDFDDFSTVVVKFFEKKKLKRWQNVIITGS